MRRGLGAASLAASMAAGCLIVTGGTDGYHGVDAGIGTTCADGSCPSLFCASAADCGDSGTNVCCLAVGVVSFSITATCQPPPCAGMPPIQLCSGNRECGDAGPCATQACGNGTMAFAVRACGSITGCETSP